MAIKHLHLDTSQRVSLLRDDGSAESHEADTLKRFKTHPQSHTSNSTNEGKVSFIGTATTVIEWNGFRIMTDPNFLHAGEHVHLGPGVNATRRTEPATQLDRLPALDCILLSHYHEDHFDRRVEESVNRAFPILTTPHAAQCLTSKDQPFQNVTSLPVFESSVLHIDQQRAIKVTAMPGKHVNPSISAINDFLQAVPPTNGWILEFGHFTDAVPESAELQVSYRIYISGDTLLVDELKEIPKWLDNRQLDLMLVHLGGTTIPGPALPLMMVTMDAEQGRQLMQLLDPKITIPIHYDDYDVFLSPLKNFKEEINQSGLQDRVVFLDRGEAYSFDI